MTKRQFVVLVFRLFALYLVFNVVTNLGYFFYAMTEPIGSKVPRIIEAGFAIFVTLWLISLLWRKSEWLMTKVFAIPVLSEGATVSVNGANSTKANLSETVADSGNNDADLEAEPIEFQDYYETPVTFEGIQVIAISLVGLWALFSRLPYLFERIILMANPGPMADWVSFDLGNPNLLANLITVVLGLWLFLRPWQFQGWIEKFKPKRATAEEAS